MSSPRRSRRLRAKAIHKENSFLKRRLQVSRRTEENDSSSSDASSERDGQSDAECDVARTIKETYVSPFSRMKKKNNFLKVYSSYNMDRDMDCYEDDFIDDTEVVRQKAQLRRKHQLRKELTPRKRKTKVLDISSDSDSGKESVISGSHNQETNTRRTNSNTATLGISRSKKRKRTIVDSSSSSSVDAEPALAPRRPLHKASVNNLVVEGAGSTQVERLNTLDLESDNDEKPLRRASASSRTAKLELLSSSSSGENDVAKKTIKKRRVRIRPDSDDDITDSTKRSSARAEQIRKQKEKEKEEKLRELQLSRSRKTYLDIASNSHSLDGKEEQNKLFESQKTLEEYFAPDPPHGMSYVISSDSGSGSEDSDWLISDHDDSTAEQDLEEALDPSMSRMVLLMSLGGVSCADLCSAAVSTTPAAQLVLAAAHADVSMGQDLAAQASVVKSAASYLQDLGLNLLELTIVAPLRSRNFRGHHKFVSSVGEMQDSVSQTDQPSLSSMESCNSTEQASASVQFQEITPTSSNNDFPLDKNMATDVFCCLQQLLCHRKWFCKELRSSLSRHPTAVELAVWHNRPKCLKLLIEVALEMKVDWAHLLPSTHIDDNLNMYETFSPRCQMDEAWPPSLLHFPFLSSIYGVLDCSCADLLQVLLPHLCKEVNLKDSEGYSPVMYAAQLGDSQSVQLLLDNGACVRQQDREGQSSLHLAAASGCVQCVRQLLQAGHVVDCQDKKGWPPLLYAHFSGHDDCFLTLMSAKPQQLSVLSALLHRTESDGTDNRRKTAKVVRELLVTLAHTESYYSLFNEFIASNMSILEEEEFGFMKHCMSLLSFENKRTWLRRKLNNQKSLAESQYVNGLQFVDLPRTDILGRTLRQMWTASALDCWREKPCVTFLNEAGMCTGPRKEFWTCLSHELVEGREKLCLLVDDSQLSLQPCKLFINDSKTLTAKVVSHHHHKLMLMGMLLATAVFHEDTLDCNLSKPLLKQLLGSGLSHPADLEEVDKHLFDQLKLLEGEDKVADLELTFSVMLPCPWEQCKHIAVPLAEGGAEMAVTNSNKMEYVKSYSRFKLEISVKAEVDALRTGFWKVVPQKYLRPFSANEFSLLLSGVPSISVDDWKRNTVYSNSLPSDRIIGWFWRLVVDLKQDEKGLLLKFCTGSPRLPPGGFSNLMGLTGPTKFTISLEPGTNRIPSAQTCFNRLCLSHYTSEQELRNKVLIALRYGCEGFEFS